MTDYAIRINIQNQSHYKEINLWFRDFPHKCNEPYIVSPIEIGTETKKQHIHIYLKTDDKKDTLVKMMKKQNLIQSGNRSYSWVQITNKNKHYKDLNEAIQYYQSYCLKTCTPNNLSYTNIDITGLPKWVSKPEFKIKKQLSIKEQIKNNYIPTWKKSESEIKKHILEYLIQFYKTNDKPFTSSMLRMYGNYLLTQCYSCIYIEDLYQQFFGRGECIF